MEYLYLCASFAGCLVLAVIIMVLRDTRNMRRYRLLQEQRPLEVQIEEIRTNAAFMADQLQGSLDRRGAQKPDALALMTDVIGYYRRLETLAAKPDASAEEIQRLADEALAYERKHCLKGVFISRDAAKLADLLRRRDGIEPPPHNRPEVK